MKRTRIADAAINKMWISHHPPYRASSKRFFNTGKVTPSSSLDETASSLHERLVKAPFQRFDPNGSPLFPWRHSPDPLPRLVEGSDDFYEKGSLLGGNVYSSNPTFDAYATAYMFLDVPLYQMLFFQYWKDDLAESMSWAFSQGVAGILSVGDGTSEAVKEGNSNIHDRKTYVDDMIETKLRELYESAQKHGKEQLQVRLECQPTGAAQIVSLFCFPFLSRDLLKREPGLKGTYRKLLEFIAVSPREALPIYQELVNDFQQRGKTESTVVCQCLMQCDEVFWVKDLTTGTIIQGQDQDTPQKVFHLVRMEMVVETLPKSTGIIPFRNKQGQWQITDIDDLLDGNLML